MSVLQGCRQNGGECGKCASSLTCRTKPFQRHCASEGDFLCISLQAMTLHLTSCNEQTKHSGSVLHRSASFGCQQSLQWCSVRSSLGLGTELPSQGHAWRPRAESSGSPVCPPAHSRETLLRTKSVVRPWFPRCNKDF